jgi:hypothetical protein
MPQKALPEYIIMLRVTADDKKRDTRQVDREKV